MLLCGSNADGFSLPRPVQNPVFPRLAKLHSVELVRNRRVFRSRRNLLPLLALRFLPAFDVTFCPFNVRIRRHILPAFCVKFGQNGVHRWATPGPLLVPQQTRRNTRIANSAEGGSAAQPTHPGKLVIPPFSPPANRQHGQQPAPRGADLVCRSAVDQVADGVHSANSPAGAASVAAGGSAVGGVTPSISSALALPVRGCWTTTMESASANASSSARTPSTTSGQ